MSGSGEVVTTYVRAGALAGVTPATVQAWVRRGHLVKPPWTVEQVQEAASMPRRRAGRPRGSSLTEHGTDARYHGGCRCSECVHAHGQESVRWRAEQREQFWLERQWRLFELLATGRPLAEACAEVGAAVQGVSSYRRRDAGFARRLDDALVAGRDPGLAHGTTTAWAAGCRCPDCRERHDASRGPDPRRRS